MEVIVVRVVWLLVSIPLDHTSVLVTMVTTKFGKHALLMVSGLTDQFIRLKMMTHIMSKIFISVYSIDDAIELTLLMLSLFFVAVVVFIDFV